MSPLRSRIPATAALAAALAAVAAAGPAHAAAPYDFDTDGRQDLVAGVPAATDAGERSAGAALVLRGTRRGVSLAERLLAQSRLGGDPAEATDGFGSAVASGDFDGDGNPDLAVGVPGENFDLANPWQGALRVIYGTGSGLDADRAQVVPGPARPGSRYSSFGASLVAGDFDRDGRDDVAVGAPWDDQTDPETTELGSGAIHLLFGSAQGITADGARTIVRPRRADRDFGRHLAVGDLDRDGHVDLVEGAQGRPDDTDGDGAPGHAYVLLGGPDGPGGGMLPGGSPWTRTGFGEGAPGPTSIAVGDVTGDGYADVVLGVPAERYVREDRAAPHGVVMLWRGARAGVAAKPVVLAQSSPGVPGSDEGRDGFGQAVAVGRLDRDRFADIVVGAPGEDGSAGRVTILRGAAGGHARTGNRAFDRATVGVPGTKRAGDVLGSALSLLDVDGDRRRDLVAGAPSRAAGVEDAIAVFRTPRRAVWSAASAQTITLRALGLRDDTADPYDAAIGAVLGRVGASS